MAQPDIFEIFEDCIQRLASGQSIDDCLRLYPQFANRLRPMLETSQSVHTITFPAAEVLEDQALVWHMIETQLPLRVVQKPRGATIFRFQLLIAILLLLLLTTIAWFLLTRPNVEEVIPLVESLTPTLVLTDTAQPSPTGTMTPTATPTSTVSQTATVTMRPSSTPQSTLTYTPQPSATMRLLIEPESRLSATVTMQSVITTETQPTATLNISPTATFVPGCGAPFTISDATELVLKIYPNTTIISAKEITRFGNVLVWDVITSHDIEIIIDVGCGTILTIERTPTADNQTSTNLTSENNNSNNSGDTSINSGSSSDNSGSSDNSNNSSSNSNSGSNSGDNSGKDSGDQNDDHSDSDSGED